MSISNLSANEKTLLETLRQLKSENQCDTAMLKLLDSLEQKSLNGATPKPKATSFVCNPVTTGSINKDNQLNDFYDTLFIPQPLSEREELIYRVNALMTFFIRYKASSYRNALDLLKNISKEEREKSLAFLQEFVDGIDLLTGSSKYVMKFIQSLPESTEEDDKKFEAVGKNLTTLVSAIQKETIKSFLEYYAVCPHNACMSAKFETCMFVVALSIIALFDTIKLKMTKDHFQFIFNLVLENMLVVSDTVELFSGAGWEEPLNFASEENDPLLNRYEDPLAELLQSLFKSL